tara:strand:+ start:442 stop:666 length:225 start_codon:yes stop_codon:yes gene_type:complete
MEGETRFGKWCDHVNNWDPLHRKNTLLLRYEDLLTNLQLNLINISDFLKVKVIKNTIPSRNELAEQADGIAVRK